MTRTFHSEQTPIEEAEAGLQRAAAELNRATAAQQEADALYHQARRVAPRSRDTDLARMAKRQTLIDWAEALIIHDLARDTLAALQPDAAEATR